MPKVESISCMLVRSDSTQPPRVVAIFQKLRSVFILCGSWIVGSFSLLCESDV